MQYFTKTAVIFLLLVVGVSMSAQAFPTVKKQGGRIVIHDRHGEAWEVTQAASIGFDPEKFQYGIGRHAFTPLDDTGLTTDKGSVSSGLRVIGVAEDGDARAYSVPKLSRHEVANSTIAASPIAVGY